MLSVIIILLINREVWQCTDVCIAMHQVLIRFLYCAIFIFFSIWNTEFKFFVHLCSEMGKELRLELSRVVTEMESAMASRSPLVPQVAQVVEREGSERETRPVSLLSWKGVSGENVMG